MLTIKKLRAGYVGIEILKGVDLVVKSNEIVALIGPNGSGKSTILKSIFNQCSIYSGNIIFDEKEITNMRSSEKILEGIGYVSQGRHVFYDMTVEENLEMGAFIIKDNRVVKENLTKMYERFPMLKEKKFLQLQEL
jgi:branched-chain amino acid transport system ATP-binding protein